MDDGTKIQGRDAFVDRVKEDKALYESLYAKVHGV